MKKLCGVNPPVITVFDGNGRIDLEACRRHADFLIEKGVDGLAYLGTSGEFSILTMDEKKSLIGEMIRYVDHRVNAIVGVGDTCLKHTMELLDFTEGAGADGALPVNPYIAFKDLMAITGLPSTTLTTRIRALKKEGRIS